MVQDAACPQGGGLLVLTDADALASKILGTPDVALAHDAVSENVLDRTDENEIGIAAQERADRSFAADDRALFRAKRGGFTPRRAEVRINGLCADCAASRS